MRGNGQKAMDDVAAKIGPSMGETDPLRSLALLKTGRQATRRIGREATVKLAPDTGLLECSNDQQQSFASGTAAKDGVFQVAWAFLQGYDGHHALLLNERSMLLDADNDESTQSYGDEN